MPEKSYRFLHLIRQDCPFPPGTHVVGYCRDSDGEEQERSVAQQDVAMHEYCDYWGLVLERVYKDEVRATAIEKRDEFTEMLNDLRERFPIENNPNRRDRKSKEKPFGVLWWKSNRIGRDRILTAYIKSDLRLRAITLVNLIPIIETGDAALDSVIESVYELQDQKLLDEISTNSKRGLADIVSLRDDDPEFLAHNPGWKSTGKYLGVFPGVPPAGFKGEKITVGTYKRRGGQRSGELRVVQRIVPDPETWAQARLAWEMRNAGAGVTDIMDAVPKLLSSKNSYTTFFSNAIYIGVLEYGGMRLENFVEPLIPVEWFEREQERIAERRKKREGKAMNPEFEPRRVGGSYLLSGLVFCGDVDNEEHPMHGDFTIPRSSGQKRWDFYICSVKKNSSNHRCRAKRVQARNLEMSVINCLMNDVLIPSKLRTVIHEAQMQFLRMNDANALRLSAAQNELKQVERQLQNITNAIEDVGLSDSLRTRLAQREADRERLSSEIRELEAYIAYSPTSFLLSDEDIERWYRYVYAALQSPNIDEARRALRLFVRKIVIRGNCGELYYTFPTSGNGEPGDSPLLGDGIVPRTRFELVFWP